MARGSRGFRWGLAACAAAGAAVRLAVYFGYYRNRDLGYNDAGYYSQTAVSLAQGHWFVDLIGRPAAEHGPVTTLLLAPVSGMGSPVNWQRLVTVVTGSRPWRSSAWWAGGSAAKRSASWRRPSPPCTPGCGSTTGW